MREEFWKKRIESVKSLLDAGLSRPETAKALGISLRTVHVYAARGGFAPKMDIPQRVKECAALGMTRKETASEIGISYHSVACYGRFYGIEFRRGGLATSDPRSEAMEAMYKAGKTLEEIGSVYSISRERVRQILTKYHGVTAKDGGQAARAIARKQRAAEKRNAKFMARYGCSFDDYKSFASLSKELRDNGTSYSRAPLGAYRDQERSAKRRNIEWSMTILEWWDIWQKSGKWALRGRGQGYMMCRFGDAGPYAVGNVYIATGVHNGTVQPNNPYRLGHPDHDDVVAAMVRNGFKRHYIDQHRTHVGLPKGVTLHKGSGRYTAQVSIKGMNRYLGMFSTPEQAHEAYMSAISDVVRAA
ncbi:sigma factor-like helix-turn-helix DNA-binding protein [Mesorhizobium sp. Root172]|uniref:sigma factor-like helix-turn-helix DNA-binding protein n=1 Tax=Mesorhizobium sp. Root172 TaxID=1736481 RepID=UPI0006F8C221|nr:sigma factor-like helix-turn-helix DNA-binding protein [Mesorhizobium sp. Root172]KRB22697.1 hypothetical protein ASE05_16075 [Mesorhizobium sp. Root172]